MTTTAICVVALFALLAFSSLVQAVKEVLVARATPPACPCRDLHSVTLTPGSVFELAPGTVIQPATEDAASGDWSGMTDRKAAAAMWCAEADLHTTFSTEGVEGVAMSFEDCRDALDIERAKQLMVSSKEERRLQGEILMLKVSLRRERRGLPAQAQA